MTRTHSCWIALVMTATPLAAEIVMAPLFQEGAVLQRDKQVPVWGRATAGRGVTVSFGGQTKATVADATGHWQVMLAAMPASAEGRSLTATETGAVAVVVKDLLVGEVWLGSGQSNMQWTIAQTRPEDVAIAAAGPVPLLRLFDVPRVLSNTRQETVAAKWTLATPETAAKFSAVGYFFGKRLADELKVPIGIIHSSWGGSRIEPWWAEEGLTGIKSLDGEMKRRLAGSPGFPEYDRPFRRYLSSIRDWSTTAEKALDAAMPVPALPQAPGLLKLGHQAEVGTYQAMIHPLVPYALRGFLWYQGESNNGEGMAYTPKMQALIAGWRQQFRASDAPFLFVQLAPYQYGENRTFELPEIWQAQQEALKIPQTGMAVINDIGNVKNIHPTYKSEVARRLSLWALADTYGQTRLVKSGPLFAKFKATGGRIAINFQHTGKGLTTRDGKPPTWFEIAGEDAVYQAADAKISGDGKSIILTSPAVSKPDRARFAWSQIAEPNLMNQEGLPAAAFNTHWPDDPSLGRKVSLGKPHDSSHPNAYGWDGGLTDGNWGSVAETCYATDDSATFPKSVTVDLGATQMIHAVGYGPPNVGATKTLSVSISEDGKTFNEVSRKEFPAKKASTARVRFEAKKARYVRATFLEQYPTQDNYNRNFGFLSELEVYAP